MNEMKLYTVRIFEDDYSLLSDEGSEPVSLAADLVNAHIQRITAKAKSDVEKKQALALAALTLAREVQRLQEAIDAQQEKQQDIACTVDQAIHSLDL